MPKYYFLGLFNFVIICTLLSCNKEKVDYAIVSGKVINAEQYLKLNAGYGTANSDKIIRLNEDGSFRDTIKTKAGRYNFFDGKNMIGLYLKPAKEYNITYDVDNFREKGMQLKGNDTLFNQYYSEKAQKRVFIDPTERTTEVEIRNFLNDIRLNELELVNSSKLSEKLKTEERERIHYQYLVDMLLCLYYGEIKEPSEITRKEFNIDYNDEEKYKTIPHYKRLVGEHYTGLSRIAESKRKLIDPNYSIDQELLKFYASEIPNEFIKNDLIEQNAAYYLRNSNNTKQFYNDYNSYYTGKDSLFMKEMGDLYATFLTLKEGTISPKFSDFKNYNGGYNSLDDYAGKHIYINVWATWCGGCYGKMDALKKLATDYEDENIVFLNIAWKDEENQWRQVIQERELADVQLLANDKDSFFEEYGIMSVPKFILIDKNGKLIDYSAPPPTDDKLEELLNNLLSEKS